MQRIGSDELWDHSEAALTQALESQGLAMTLNPGDGAFYGPKIDMHMTDSLGRSWQLGTVQLDYNLPARFNLSYTGADNAEHRPVMIHRALMGSYERFIGILLEHIAGELPLWLTPSRRSCCRSPTATSITRERSRAGLREHGVRAELDERDRVGGAQDPRRRAAQDPLHARRRRPRARQRGEVSVREHRGGDTGSDGTRTRSPSASTSW